MTDLSKQNDATVASPSVCPENQAIYYGKTPLDWVYEKGLVHEKLFNSGRAYRTLTIIARMCFGMPHSVARSRMALLPRDRPVTIMDYGHEREATYYIRHWQRICKLLIRCVGQEGKYALDHLTMDAVFNPLYWNRARHRFQALRALHALHHILGQD